ncbi:class I SAM-dependent methyltransferase [Vibrio gallicus]|uniref:class I SAM-dependent methyltransferase n=1 Tax=Vibrio gallicus TaxID=190897 RepID=UPI0021C30B13|nr:class I SAM-dependent methyltransferase [Vibrio gallicus]
MNPVDIGKAYDQITERWTSNNFNMNNGIEAHKRALSFVENKGQALDIGCGCSGRFVDLLLEEGFEVEGIDVSRKMIDIASNKHPQVRFIHADICEYPLSRKYSFITAWDSLWHLPLSQQKSTLIKIVDSLASGGVFIFSFGGTEQSGEHSNDVMGPKVAYSSLGLNGFLQLFVGLRCKIRHLEFDQHPELHTYLIIEKI